jgi:prostamide/prostaglandin F2alpha synthase
LQGARSQFAQAGADVVLIGQATPRDAANFRRQFKIDLPILADEKRTSYEAVGAKMSGVSGLLGPKVAIRGIKTALGKGVMQGKTIGHPAQLGASMVIAPGGEVLFKQLANDASDNAPPEQMLEALGAGQSH